MAVFDKIRTKVIPLIKKFGADNECYLVINTEAAAADPSKPWDVGLGTPTRILFRGVVTDAPFADSTEGEVQKHCIVPGDIAQTPTLQHRVEIVGGQNAGTYAIVTMNTYAPDGIAIGYKLLLNDFPFVKSASKQGLG